MITSQRKFGFVLGLYRRVRLEEARLKEQYGKTYTDRQTECSEPTLRKWQSKVAPSSSIMLREEFLISVARGSQITNTWRALPEGFPVLS